MIEGVTVIGGIAVFFASLYAVSYLPAKWMVKKRILLAKRHLIGQETPEKIKLFKQVATETLNKNTIYLELLEKEHCTVTTTVNCGEICNVKVENNLVEVYACNNGAESVCHKACDEKDGTRATAFDLSSILFAIFACCFLLFAT